MNVYVIPQLKGWIENEILSNYGIYLNQHATGEPWDVLFILEYKDIKAFAQRDVLKWKVRENLKDNPSWKLISDIKWNYRSEKETVIAKAITLGPKSK